MTLLQAASSGATAPRNHRSVLRPSPGTRAAPGTHGAHSHPCRRPRRDHRLWRLDGGPARCHLHAPSRASREREAGGRLIGDLPAPSTMLIDAAAFAALVIVYFVYDRA